MTRMRASGAKINLSKCSGLWCGAFAWPTDQVYGFDWFNDYIPDKILGQFLSSVDCTKLNWDCKVKKITPHLLSLMLGATGI